MIKAIWSYRNFILGLVKRDFRSRYLNSLFGSVWSILNPLAIILVYTLIFSTVMSAKLPGVDDTFAYSIYLCAGLLPWQYFVETVQRLLTVFIDNGNLLKKVSFPRTTLPIYVHISSSINFFIISLLFIVFLIIKGSFPFQSIMAVIPLLLVQQLFALGLGIFLGSINVFFRDVGQFFGVLLQFWFWFTPIVYTRDIVPEGFDKVLDYNILLPIFEGYQGIFLYNKIPVWNDLMPICVITILLLLISYFIFKKLESEMVDEL
jgi:lipopolysaccharide transport system permease protein